MMRGIKPINELKGKKMRKTLKYPIPLLLYHLHGLTYEKIKKS